MIMASSEPRTEHHSDREQNSSKNEFNISLQKDSKFVPEDGRPGGLVIALECY